MTGKMHVVSNKIMTAFMALSNLMFASVATLAAIIELSTSESSPETDLYLILAIIMGILNFLIGSLLVVAFVKGNERYLFFYLVLELSNLIIITIFAGINCFESLYIGLFFPLCIIQWYGLYCMYYLYLELSEYNSVQSGVIEITCNTNADPVAFPDKAVESTAV